MSAVSCASARACTAVGYRGRAEDASLAERWNGTRWSIQRLPGGISHIPVDVSCTSAGACTAVGYSFKHHGVYVVLAWRWNGSKWSSERILNPAHGGGLPSGVSCWSANACTAVGSDDRGFTLAERWNGSRWLIQQTLRRPGGGPTGAALLGVSCKSAHTCIAVGGNFNHWKTLAERWIG